MDIYEESGYLNIPGILEECQRENLNFIFITGGRGTGKTYGALKHLIESGTHFMFMRRLQTQLDVINKPDYSPVKPLNEDCGWNIQPFSVSKYTSAFYRCENDESGKPVKTGAPIGYTCALSTVSNLRGFDASQCQVILYDEFIPEAHERPIKAEGDALLNAYETINRNRELKGQPPITLLCLSNANNLGNAVYMRLGLVMKAERLRKQGRSVYKDKSRGVCVIILKDSPISNAKRNTALYKLAEGTSFSAMALDNDFANAERGDIRSRPLKEYRPVVAVGELCVYRHKSNGSYYICDSVSGSPDCYGSGPTELTRFQKNCLWLWDLYLSRRITFSDYMCEILFVEYWR